jgi:serine/threonine protein kinase HipA of HipAB toxin-antitoxin module
VPELINCSPRGYADDDHLRNHGFLYESSGWHLSPLFDINPNPRQSTLRQTSFAGYADAEGSMAALDKFEASLSL